MGGNGQKMPVGGIMASSGSSNDLLKRRRSSNVPHLLSQTASVPQLFTTPTLNNAAANNTTAQQQTPKYQQHSTAPGTGEMLVQSPKSVQSPNTSRRKTTKFIAPLTLSNNGNFSDKAKQVVKHSQIRQQNQVLQQQHMLQHASSSQHLEATFGNEQLIRNQIANTTKGGDQHQLVDIDQTGVLTGQYATHESNGSYIIPPPSSLVQQQSSKMMLANSSSVKPSVEVVSETKQIRRANKQKNSSLTQQDKLMKMMRKKINGRTYSKPAFGNEVVNISESEESPMLQKTTPSSVIPTQIMKPYPVPSLVSSKDSLLQKTSNNNNNILFNSAGFSSTENPRSNVIQSNKNASASNNNMLLATSSQPMYSTNIGFKAHKTPTKTQAAASGNNNESSSMVAVTLNSGKKKKIKGGLLGSAAGGSGDWTTGAASSKQKLQHMMNMMTQGPASSTAATIKTEIASPRNLPHAYDVLDVAHQSHLNRKSTASVAFIPIQEDLQKGMRGGGVANNHQQVISPRRSTFTPQLQIHHDSRKVFKQSQNSISNQKISIQNEEQPRIKIGFNNIIETRESRSQSLTKQIGSKLQLGSQGIQLPSQIILSGSHYQKKQEEIEQQQLQQKHQQSRQRFTSGSSQSNLMATMGSTQQLRQKGMMIQQQPQNMQQKMPVVQKQNQTEAPVSRVKIYQPISGSKGALQIPANDQSRERLMSLQDQSTLDQALRVEEFKLQNKKKGVLNNDSSSSKFVDFYTTQDVGDIRKRHQTLNSDLIQSEGRPSSILQGSHSNQQNPMLRKSQQALPPLSNGKQPVNFANTLQQLPMKNLSLNNSGAHSKDSEIENNKRHSSTSLDLVGMSDYQKQLQAQMQNNQKLKELHQLTQSVAVLPNNSKVNHNNMRNGSLTRLSSAKKTVSNLLIVANNATDTEGGKAKRPISNQRHPSRGSSQQKRRIIDCSPEAGHVRNFTPLSQHKYSSNEQVMSQKSSSLKRDEDSNSLLQLATNPKEDKRLQKDDTKNKNYLTRSLQDGLDILEAHQSSSERQRVDTLVAVAQDAKEPVQERHAAFQDSLKAVANMQTDKKCMKALMTLADTFKSLMLVTSQSNDNGNATKVREQDQQIYELKDQVQGMQLQIDLLRGYQLDESHGQTKKKKTLNNKIDSCLTVQTAEFNQNQIYAQTGVAQNVSTDQKTSALSGSGSQLSNNKNFKDFIKRFDSQNIYQQQEEETQASPYQQSSIGVGLSKNKSKIPALRLNKVASTTTSNQNSAKNPVGAIAISESADSAGVEASDAVKITRTQLNAVLSEHKIIKHHQHNKGSVETEDSIRTEHRAQLELSWTNNINSDTTGAARDLALTLQESLQCIQIKDSQAQRSTLLSITPASIRTISQPLQQQSSLASQKSQHEEKQKPRKNPTQNKKKITKVKNLSLAGAMQAMPRDTVKDFQDEFMGKYDEFSQSWRDQIDRQKRF